MTIINGIEIDHINYIENAIKAAIINNDPIEDKLHVIAVVSNPCLFARRYILMREFIKRFEMEETAVELYIVELAYGDQKFIITDNRNKRHLQLRTDVPLWHKENMVNLGVKRLLPKNWKAMAWIDADIEFENHSWATDTLKILNGTKDIVQLFSQCLDLDRSETIMKVHTSSGYHFAKRLPYGSGINHWHPGYAWAITRKAFEKMGGLYEDAILGSGDNIMMHCLLNNGSNVLNEDNSDDYKEGVLAFERRVRNLRFGYVPGVIRHFYHGSKKNRFYQERWKILVDHQYQPSVHIRRDKNGIIVPTPAFSEELKRDIFNYFASRNEDEGHIDTVIL
jgi:hypothetical protein